MVRASDGPENEARLFLRGAPVVIRDLVEPSSLPSDFDEVRPVAAGLLHHTTCWFCSSQQ